MREKRWHKIVFLILGCYSFALCTVCPLPFELQSYRPLWVWLFVMYCAQTLSPFFNPCVACGIGLWMDSLLGVPLGQHALVLTTLAYWAALWQKNVPWYWQWGRVAVALGFGQGLLVGLHSLSGYSMPEKYWLGVMVSSALWPLFAWFCHRAGSFFFQPKIAMSYRNK